MPADRQIVGCLSTILLLACSAALAYGAVKAQFRARVVSIADGDSITVLRGERDQVRIRLRGIDAPERRQPFGSKARQFLGDLCAGQIVTIRQTDVDRYGRIVAEVVLPDGRVANHEIVRAGLAWWFRKYAPDDEFLAGLESQARRAGRGLWSVANPIPPWDWRRGARAASTE